MTIDDRPGSATAPAPGAVSRIIAEASFRYVRLEVEDLRAVAALLLPATSMWRCETEFVRKRWPHARRTTSRAPIHGRRIYESSSLDELITHAPVGRLPGFQVSSEGPAGKVPLATGERRLTGSRLTVRCEAPGKEVPDVLHRLGKILDPISRRGWQRSNWGLAALAAPFAIPILILDRIASLGLLTDPGTRGNLDAGIGLSVFAFLALVPFGVVFYLSSAASTVRLKPRFSAVSPRDLKRLGQWVRGVFSADSQVEQKMLVATICAALAGLASLLVAILAWLLPLK